DARELLRALIAQRRADRAELAERRGDVALLEVGLAGTPQELVRFLMVALGGRDVGPPPVRLHTEQRAVTLTEGIEFTLQNLGQFGVAALRLHHSSQGNQPWVRPVVRPGGTMTQRRGDGAPGRGEVALQVQRFGEAV